MDIPFITKFGKNLFVPKEKKDPNKVEVPKVDILKKPKLTPEELDQDMKANRGTGYHVNKKDKRSNNPFKNSDFD